MSDQDFHVNPAWRLGPGITLAHFSVFSKTSLANRRRKLTKKPKPLPSTVAECRWRKGSKLGFDGDAETHQLIVLAWQPINLEARWQTVRG
jgi:hypothetical protein